MASQNMSVYNQCILQWNLFIVHYFWQCACVLALACGGNVGSHRVNTVSLIPSYLYTFSSRSVFIKLSRLLHNVYYKQNNSFQKEIARAFKQIVKVVIK